MSLSETKNDEKTTNLTESTNKILTELTNEEAPKIKFENATEGTTNIQNEAQEGLDEENQTYRNSKSDLTFNLYDQTKYKGLAAAGCMNTSAACVSSAIDKSITPASYRKHYAHNYVYDSIPKMTNNKLQSKVLLPGEKNKWTDQQTQEAQTEIEKNLEKGYPAIFMVRGPKRGGKNTITTSQHYMAAVDIRENGGKKEVFIANTYNGKLGGRIPVDKAFVSMKQASIYTPA